MRKLDFAHGQRIRIDRKIMIVRSDFDLARLQLLDWMIPGKRVKGMGGAMDLVSGVQRVLVVMEHSAQDGTAKLLRQCTLPLTGACVVERVITDLCVLDVTSSGFEVIELADRVTREQVERQTEASVRFAKAVI